MIPRSLILTFDEGDRHPINRVLAQPTVRLFAIGAVLAGMLALGQVDTPALLVWTPQLFPRSNYFILFPALYALVVALRLLPAQRRAILVGAGLALACVFDWRFAAGSVVYLGALYLVLYARLPAWAKLLYLVASIVAVGAACDLLLAPDWLSSHRFVLVIGYAFAVCYVLRLVYFFHEARMSGFKRVPLADFAAYFFFAPFYVVFPFMLCIPRFGRFREHLEKPWADGESSGVRYLLSGILLWLLHMFIRDRLVNVSDAIRVSFAAHAWARLAALAIVARPIGAVLPGCAQAYFLAGMTHLLGFRIQPAMERPLLAKGILEWWRRWNTHLRDVLVDVFFYPVMLRLRRKNPYLAIFAGCVSVFLVGSVLLHETRTYFRFGSHRHLDYSIIAESVGMVIVVGAALALEKRRALRKLPAPRITPLRAIAGAIATQIALLLIVNVVGDGAEWAAHARPVARTADTDVAGLRWLVELAPAEPVRRLRLARALAVAGDLDGARENATIARRFRGCGGPELDVNAPVCIPPSGVDTQDRLFTDTEKEIHERSGDQERGP
jgi:D-alanyl-lipoteichoic acid acyltransferase DltB (MBOAT superfamily)